ncbi:MAG: hydantoinase B/oxoprolinase family protein [Promethearchaeota archaeon]
MHSSDPAKLEIMKNTLFSIAEEMGSVLIRAAYSTNIKDRRDCSCGIYTIAGDLSAQAEHIPLHLGIMPSAVKSILQYLDDESIEIEEGDTILCNDPFITGSHTWDLMLVTPVFYKEKMAALVGNLAHYADIGEHKSHVASEALDEGIRIPPVKLVKNNNMSSDILNLVKSNVRVKEVERDLRAQVGANIRGVTRLSELFTHETLDIVCSYMDELIRYSERRLRSAISNLPKKTTNFQDYIEGDGINDDLIKIMVTISVKDSDIHFDFSGTSSKTIGPINSPLPVTFACTGYCVKSLLDPDVPSNEGVFRPIHITAPEGSLLNAVYPSAVAYANSVTCMRIVDTILGAFKDIIPSKICAASTGTMNALNIKGTDPRTGRFYGYIETYAGGWGAMKNMDGMDATHTHMTNTLNAPIEAIEIAYPLRVQKYGILQDSEGAGRKRGGVGITREIEAINHVATLGGRGDRFNIRPWGLMGGQDARSSKYYKKLHDGSIVELPSKFQGIILLPGERIVIETAGGGGWGDPREREAKLIKSDIVEGFISPKKAKKVYLLE